VNSHLKGTSPGTEQDYKEDELREYRVAAYVAGAAGWST